MGYYSDNFYSWLDRQHIAEKTAMDTADKGNGYIHPDTGTPCKAKTKEDCPKLQEEQKKQKEQEEGDGRDIVKSDEEPETITLPNGKRVSRGQKKLYTGPDGKPRNTRYSPFLAKMGGTGDISQEFEDVLDRLFGGEDVPDSEIEAIPEWKQAMERAADIEKKIAAEHGSPYTVDIDSPERDKAREEIIQAALTPHMTKEVPILSLGTALETNEGLKDGESYDVEQGHKAFIAIGFPAAGKSTTFANPLALKHKARLCDSDSIKKVLPEFQNGYGGNAVHEESARLNEEVLQRAIEQGDNIVYPILGFKPEKLRALMEMLKSKGYEVNLCFKDMPVNMAKGRLLVRFLQKGRYLPLSCISKAKGGVEKSFEANKGLADNYVRTTNADPYGVNEKVLDSKGEILEFPH